MSAQQYRQEGYLVYPTLFGQDHIDRLRMRMDDIAEGRAPDFPQSNIEFEPGSGRRSIRKINRCAENDPVFFEHAGNDAILDIVEELIGPDIKLFASQCFMKPPGGVEKPWHQDSAYFSIEPTNLVTCWLALDDVTLENGCLRVIPGSHREGLVEHDPWQLGDREDKQVGEDRLDRDREKPIVMPAGGCSFHHSVLLHRSGPNRSDQPRRGLAVHYMSSKCRWTDSESAKPDYRLLRGREFPGCV